MCGRFTLTASGEQIAEEFGLDEVPLLGPRFNIAPSQPIVTIGVDSEAGRRRLAERIWGFNLEGGATSRVAGARRFINARSETAARSPAFRQAFLQRRCLIPATGFYEWRKTPGSRAQPWLFQRTDGRPFAFAGLWQPVPEGSGAGCLILTTEANELAREVHDRMPAILRPEDFGAWLDTALGAAARLQPLLRPFPPQAMSAFAVSTAINNPAFDAPSCIAPVPPGGR
jgi:putative SOS response-associated peptidase YedK